MLFISSYKLFSFARYLNFCLDFLVMQKKWLDWKDEVNFKIYDVTVWLANNCNTHIAQYLTKWQPDNEIWSVNRMEQEKYFPSKIIQRKRRGGQFQTTFCFFKKSLCKVKENVLRLRFIIFQQPSNQHAIKTNCNKIRLLNQR